MLYKEGLMSKHYFPSRVILVQFFCFKYFWIKKSLTTKSIKPLFIFEVTFMPLLCSCLLAFATFKEAKKQVGFLTFMVLEAQ